MSIVPGNPIAGKPNSVNFNAPLNDPSPPITTRQSIPYFLRTFTPIALPSSVLNSSHLEDFNIVPPPVSYTHLTLPTILRV